MLRHQLKIKRDQNERQRNDPPEQDEQDDADQSIEVKLVPESKPPDNPPPERISTEKPALVQKPLVSPSEASASALPANTENTPIPPEEKRQPSRLNHALAKANDSRRKKEESERPREQASRPSKSASPAPNSNPQIVTPRKKPLSGVDGPTFMDLFLDFRRFTDGIHPLKGWGEAFLLVLISGLAWSQIALMLFIPDHPGPMPLTGNTTSLVLLFLQDISMGVLGWLLMGMFVHGLFFVCGGRPPLLWTLKVLVYALLPFTLTRIGFILYGFQSGTEAYIRGYRPGWVLEYVPLFYTVLLAWAGVRLALSTRSKHCQGKFGVGLGIFMILPGFSLAWTLAGMEIRTVFHGKEVMEHWEDAHDSWQAQHRREGLMTLNLLEAIPLGMDVQMKADFYLMRGELRMLSGDVLGARQDFLSLSHLMPKDHSHHRLGRGANLLLLSRADLGLPHLERAAEMTPESADVQRWLAWIKLGRFGDADTDLQAAEGHARQAMILAPNALHQQVLLEALHAQNRHEEILRLVDRWAEVEIYRADVLYMLSDAALALGRAPESRVWAERAEERAARH